MNTNPIFYIPGRRSYTAALTRFLAELLPAVDHTRPLIILCIGTTQVQGDRLGPLVGTLLEEKLKKTVRLLPVHIFGTEEQAVHALNLPVILRAISRDFPGAPFWPWMPPSLSDTAPAALRLVWGRFSQVPVCPNSCPLREICISPERSAAPALSVTFF